MFTNVPVAEALMVVRWRLMADDTLIDRTLLTSEQVIHLLELCLKETYFTFHGTAMGCTVSPTVSSIYFETFEELAPSATPLAPRRFVDDTFCVLKKTDVSKFWTT